MIQSPLMKLERAQEYLTTFIAVAVGMLAAYYVGTLSGHGQFGRIGAMLLTAVFMALLLALREQIWLLIPFSLPFVGQLMEIKGHPAIRDVAVFAVFGGVLALRAFKIIRRKPTYDAIDFWGGLMLLYLLTVYIRNPVGETRSVRRASAGVPIWTPSRARWRTGRWRGWRCRCRSPSAALSRSPRFPASRTP